MKNDINENPALSKTSVSKSAFKYIILKNPITTESLEIVDVSCLTKKELKYFLSLGIVNDNYEIKYEECKYHQTEVYDNGWHTIRKNLNLHFPLKFNKTIDDLMKEYPTIHRY